MAGGHAAHCHDRAAIFTNATIHEANNTVLLVLL